MCERLEGECAADVVAEGSKVVELEGESGWIKVAGDDKCLCGAVLVANTTNRM